MGADYVDVHLKDGRIWRFEWDEAAKRYCYRTPKNIYALFWEGRYATGLWIGRYYVGSAGDGWYTVETQLGATHAELSKGKFCWRTQE